MAAVTPEANLSEKSFEHTWVLNNWGKIIRDESLIQNTNTEFKCIAENMEYARFMVGLKIFSIGQRREVGFYWKLLCKHYCLLNVGVDLAIEVLQGNGTTYSVNYKSQSGGVIGNTIDFSTRIWGLLHNWTDSAVSYWANSEGSVVLKLNLKVTNLSSVVIHSNLEQILKSCKEECNQHFAALLEDKLSSDVKICTKDNVELPVHKLILRARCPVFATMFESDFLESKTNMVTVDDVSAKTMKILLNYWYSGELLSSWKDDDTIVEFAYAAGKYQMTKVLQILDETLGLEFRASHEDVEVLKMIQNLSLKNAETRMLKRIVHKISQVTSGAELLEIYSMDADDYDENTCTAGQILKAYDDALSDNANNDACSSDIKLLALACKLGMKNVENGLLQRIVGSINKLGTSAELFALFDQHSDKSDDDLKQGSFLVPTNRTK